VTIINNAAIEKMISLCSLIQTICGKTVTNDASAAPAPRLTKSAGIAQQIKVLELANRLSNEPIKVVFVSPTPF
jgi:hypothetical protein